jgi:tRNA C32,U32 (ribose-2'-O)-methylase TrmJ
MNASNKEYTLLHADAEWMKNILERMSEILQKTTLDSEDINSLRWLIKQARKIEREE